MGFSTMCFNTCARTGSSHFGKASHVSAIGLDESNCVITCEEHSISLSLWSSGVARGAMTPKLLVNVFFSPIYLRCYVLLVCKLSLGGDNSVVQQ